MDLVYRQAAIDTLNVGTELLRRVLDDTDIVGAERAKIEFGLELIASCISDMKELPSAQPEIIRCKECRYYEWMSNRVPDEQTWFCHNWNAETGKDDYCSYAERREDEQADV